MNHLQIFDERGKKHSFTGPAKWSELTEQQLLAWAGLCLKKLPFDHMVKAAFILLYRIPPKLFFRVPGSQIIQIAGRLEFLWKENKLTSWLIKEIQFRGTKYYGPANSLSNITIAEYRITEIYYQAYLRTKDKHYLYLLLATLYRPKRKGIINSDIREDIREYEINRRADKFKGVQIGSIRVFGIKTKYLQAVLLNYEGCRNYITSTFPTVFTRRSNNEIRPTNSERLFDFEEVIDTVAGGAFGDAEKTGNTNLFRFLKYLSKQIEQAEELKRKSKSRT